ncbi:hypothetical protein ACJMK2_027795 [Sinanodonta woodiana]|uniref:Nephrocystin 3-like N-terminal domain-containing protein n=1 Tax=Sinanodonta woodiana TaxID=1069815 RepID=A0ABD3X768_SINWO
METDMEKAYDYRSTWEKLKDKLEDELDDYQTLEARTLMNDKLDRESVADCPSKLLECLENNYTLNECFKILRDVFEKMKVHVVSDGRNLVEIIDEYRNQLRLGDCMDLIGREEQVLDIMKNFVENNCKGIWLCGMGGMGKTMLAQEVCCRLRHNFNYIVVNIDMKGKDSLVDLSREILLKQNLLWGESGQRLNREDSSARSSNAFILKSQVLESLQTFSNDSVLLIDNMDDVQSEEGEELTLYLIDLLSKISELGDECKLQVLITARHKFINTMLENGQKLNDRYCENHWREIELNGLSPEAGQKLAMTSDLPWHRRLSVEESYQVAKACGGCPLGICILSRYIQQPRSRTVADVISSVEGRLSDIVPCCIEKSFEELPEETKEQFIQLSVFNTCPFNVQSTAAIWFNDTSQQSIAKAEMGLKQLQYRHMVQCVRPCNPCAQGLLTDSEKDISTYALHPLVFSSISILLGNNIIHLGNSLNKAKARFLDLYLSKLLSIEESLERERYQAFQIVASDKVHLRNIFQWNNALPFSISSNLKLIHSLGITTSKLLTTFAKIINKPKKTLQVFKNLTETSKILGDKDACFFWSVQQAEACLDCDEIKNAEEILQRLHIDDQYYCNEESTTDVYGLFSAAEFHYVQGMLCNKNKQYSQSLSEFQKSLELFRKCKPDKAFTVYEAAAINAKGNVHFKLEEYSNALECHERAYELIDRKFGGDFHEHKSIYLHNIGSIQHVLALKDWDRNKEDAKHLLEKALEKYDTCINQDYDYKQTSDPYHADRRRIRSDIYLRLKRFDEAFEDAERALKIQKQLHDKEHPSITISRYQLARCYMKRAKENKKNGHRAQAYRDQTKCWNCFVQIQDDIAKGGLSRVDQQYFNIRNDHLKLVKRYSSGRLDHDKLKRFYARFEAKGKLGRSLSSSSESDNSNNPSSDEGLDDSVPVGRQDSGIGDSLAGSSIDSIPSSLHSMSLEYTPSIEEVFMDDDNMGSGNQSLPEGIVTENLKKKKRKQIFR